MSFNLIKEMETSFKKSKDDNSYYINKIRRFLENRDSYEVQQTPVLPDGSPIGTEIFCSQPILKY
jgi:uncharacterized Fe-S center protein